MKGYPMVLDLRDRLAVVVGDDRFAGEKVDGLLAVGARVRWVGPDQPPRDDGALQAVRRTYRHGDLADASLVICTRRGTAEADRVWRDAEALRIPVNVLDDVTRCSFHSPAVVRRGDLLVAISTGGHAPALAVRLRQQLERSLGSHLGRFLELAERLRPQLAHRRPDFEDRRRRWYRLVDSEVPDLLRRGEDERAERRAVEILGLPPRPESAT